MNTMFVHYKKHFKSNEIDILKKSKIKERKTFFVLFFSRFFEVSQLSTVRTVACETSMTKAFKQTTFNLFLFFFVNGCVYLCVVFSEFCLFVSEISLSMKRKSNYLIVLR